MLSTASDTYGGSLPGLRARVKRDAWVVGGVTGALVVAGVASDLPATVFLAIGSPDRHTLEQITLALAVAHLAMFVFGGRRASDLKSAFVRGQRAEAVLWHRARHDELTGLLNRSGFSEELAAQGDDVPLVLIMVDLDRFKDINDTLGHHVGDGLLTAVAARLRDAVRSDVVLARLGGDEFVLLLRDCTFEEGRLIAERVLRVLRQPYEVDGLPLEVDASLGVAASAGDGAEGVLRRADLAMYDAKDAQLGVAVHTPELEEKARRQADLLVQLRRAIRERELSVHYQPKVIVIDGRVRSVEALVRWYRPAGDPVAPDDFVPLAEATGLMWPITAFVLDRALTDCRTWRQQGLELRVAVNLSTSSLLNNHLPDEIAGLLARHGLTADCLELEITENAAMREPEAALRVLGRLRDMGIQLSIDDYGTGHASLAYLTRLPVSCLKIDRSFVQSLELDAHDAVIVRSTIELAHSLGLRVVAEGVETRSAWRRLRELGCDEGQGYWLGRPVPAAALPGVIAGASSRVTSAAGTAEEPGPLQ